VDYRYFDMAKVFAIGVVIYLCSLEIDHQSMAVSVSLKLMLMGLYGVAVYLVDRRVRDAFSRAGTYFNLIVAPKKK
jgi:hypothetical protein